MKLLRMKIRRQVVGGGTHYSYPKPHYDPQKVVFGPIYESSLPENEKAVRGRGNIDEFIVIGVKDEDLEQFLGANKVVIDGFIYSAKEINEDLAIADGEKWTKQVEKITDQTAVLLVTAKVIREEELTTDERKILDPKDETPGVVKTKPFRDSLKEAKDKF